MLVDRMTEIIKGNKGSLLHSVMNNQALPESEKKNKNEAMSKHRQEL
jgi:hypothetical protein